MPSQAINKNPATRNRNKLPPKQKGMLCKATLEACKLSAEYEVPPVQAYQAITGRIPAPTTVKRMETEIERWSLKHPTSLKSASQSIKKFSKGHDVNGIKPNASTVLAASQRIVDASDPVIKRSETVNVNIQVDPVDLSKYRR